MSGFQNYLIKFPRTGKLFPHELIQEDTYKCTPLQRTEIKAYRDDGNLLHRTTSPNYKTKIEFQTVDGMTLEQLSIIRQRLNAAIVNAKERKLSVEYWDDELLAYRTMSAAYLPDTTYNVKVIKNNSVIYSPITFTFIEY